MPVDARIPGITLKQGEEVVFIAKPHWIVLLRLRNLISYVFTLGVALVWSFFRWKNAVYVLTTQRVILQYGFISRLQQSVDLSKIQDVQFAIVGLLRRLLGVGNVCVETAGSGSNIEMLCVPRPQELCDQVQDQMQAAKKGEMLEMARAMRNVG